MRRTILISAAAATLVLAGLVLLRSGPAPVKDELLPDPLNPDAVLADSVLATSAAPGKPDSDAGVQARALDAAVAPLPGSAAGEGLPKGFGRLEPGQEKAYLQAAPLSRKELASVETLLRSFQLGRGREALNKLVRHLRTQGLDPLIAKDSNPSTGQMLNIRTSEALEGTKHFHAVYVEDESRNKDPFPQHLSFETRATADCMAKAEQLLKKVYGAQLGEPVRRRGDEWVEWKVGDYSVWIHRLGLDDIRHDPFNARTLEDLGNCKAAIELIPEDEQAHL